jgi:hypothetical protein
MKPKGSLKSDQSSLFATTGTQQILFDNIILFSGHLENVMLGTVDNVKNDFVFCVRQRFDNMSNVLWSLKDVADSVFDICYDRVQQLSKMLCFIEPDPALPYLLQLQY